MKQSEVKVGGCYAAKVNGRVTTVRIDAVNPGGGWDATNLATGRKVRIRSAQRLRQETTETGKAATKPAAKPAKPKQTRKPKAPNGSDRKMSCLDAAAKVLAEAGEPLNCLAMFDRMHAKGYWTSEKATPQNTIYAAILRHMQKHGSESRFRKVGRGKFALAE